jgi:hypothetical protein
MWPSLFTNNCTLLAFAVKASTAVGAFLCDKIVEQRCFNTLLLTNRTTG